MPSVFNIIRGCLYAAILIFTVVCFAVAVHFQTLLATSDLTRFVPFSIFVCVVGLLIILALIGFSLRKQLNPISTRMELACLAFAGTLWIALGAFLATSDSDDAEVECYASDSLTVPLGSDAPFNTGTYHAQYHVLEAFSLFNAILFWGFFFFLLFIAVRQHLNGEPNVWHVPVNIYPFFNLNRYVKSTSGKLPAPVTSHSRSRSRGRSYNEKNVGSSSRHNTGNSRRTERSAVSAYPSEDQQWTAADRLRASWARKPSSRKPEPAHVRDRHAKQEEFPTRIHDKFARGASPRR